MKNGAPDYERIVRLQMVGSTFMATIPRPAIHRLGWMPAENLHIEVRGRQVIIEAVSDHYVRLAPAGAAEDEPAEPAEASAP